MAQEYAMGDEFRLGQEVIEAFNLMWRHFPNPVLLIYKDRTILAANPAGLAIGRKPGLNCAGFGRKEGHYGCLASRALAEQKPQCLSKEIDGVMKTVYWLPVEGCPDIYIHLSGG